MDSKMKVALGGLAVTLALAAAGMFLLPDTLAMQIGLSGQLQNYAPKAAALLLPVGLSLLGVVMSRGEGRRSGGTLLALVSPLIMLLTFAMNWGR